MTDKIKTGFARATMVITLIIALMAPHFALAVPDPWTFICDTDNCDTFFRQTEEGWTLIIVCADGDFDHSEGTGIWGGTITCSP